MIPPVVVHIDDGYDEYIGRGSIWGNPYSHRHDTLAQCIVATRDLSISSYEPYARGNQEIMNNLHTLSGKRIGCHCKNKHGKGKSCHGDILVKLFIERYGDNG